MAESIEYKVFESAVDPARIPGRAPTVLLLGPVHAGSQGLAKNLSDEGYQVVLVDTAPGLASIAALRRRRRPPPPPAAAAAAAAAGAVSVEGGDGEQEHLADQDMQDTDGWAVAMNLIRLVDGQLEGGWNRYTALITLRLDRQDVDLVHALHTESSKRGGLSAYVGYGTQLSTEQALGVIEQSGSFPILAHLPEAETELIEALVEAAKTGDIPQDALPFHPQLDHFTASLGPVKARNLSIFTYASINAQTENDDGDDASVWACAFPFSHHTKDFAFATRTEEDGVSSKIGDGHRSAAAMSYSRTLALLKSTMGPRFPLEQLWDQHTYFEFASRDSAKTMSTMVAQPYVNHVACLTGGAGFVQLARFYEHHFTTVSPPDTTLVPISRTVGTDRIIDEMVFSCTHTTTIDYFLPGIPPTGKKLRIPMVGIVNLRGDKLAYESLYWDQANALVQLGFLHPEKSSTVQGVALPITGDQVAQKILHPYGVPSNELMPNWGESENKPVPASSTSPHSH